MKKLKNTNRRGFIFIMAYLMIVLFMVYELALLTYFAQNINAFERFSNNTIAYQLAEAGLDSAMAKLKNNQIVFDANGNYTETRDFTLGNYNVTVSNQQEDLDGDGASDGPLAPNIFRITTLASAPAVSNPARPIQQATNVVAYVRKEENPLFEYAVFGSESVNLRNLGVSGGFDSRDDDSPGFLFNQHQSPLPMFLQNFADLGTDSSASGAIRIIDDMRGNNDYLLEATGFGQPTAPIQLVGNVVVGPGGNPSEVIDTGVRDPSVVIAGTTGAAAVPKNYAPLTTDVPSSGDCVVPGHGRRVLSSGTYHCDSLTMEPNSYLESNGPVKIYVDGPVVIEDAFFRGYGEVDLHTGRKRPNPRNLLIYVTGDDDVTIKNYIPPRNNVGLDMSVGAIYAPNSRVRYLEGPYVKGFLLGAVIAREFVADLTPNNHGDSFCMDGRCWRLHYMVFDEALRDIGGGQGTQMKLVSWRTVPIEPDSTESLS